MAKYNSNKPFIDSVWNTIKGDFEEIVRSPLGEFKVKKWQSSMDTEEELEVYNQGQFNEDNAIENNKREKSFHGVKAESKWKESKWKDSTAFDKELIVKAEDTKGLSVEFTEGNIAQAIIYSEIFGQPKCKTRIRRRCR